MEEKEHEKKIIKWIEELDPTKIPMMMDIFSEKMQTESMCMAAIKRNPLAIKSIKIKQTEELCLAAVTKDGTMLRYVDNKTARICVAAIVQNMNAFKYIKTEDYSYHKHPVPGDPPHITRLEYMKIAEIVLKHNGRMIRFVDREEQTERLCLIAVKQNGIALKYAQNKTKDVCHEAIKQNPSAVKYIRCNV